MLGYAAAKQVVERGRGAFFPAERPDLPISQSEIVGRDDRTPQFGFVGARFSTTRVPVLLLGINPGNGDRDRRSDQDAQMMTAMHSFAKSPTEQTFAAATAAYMRECRSWRYWQNHCDPVIRAGNWSFDEIAYSNALPWRTQSESGFLVYPQKKAAELYIAPLIKHLKPRLIVAIGCKAEDILHRTGVPLPEVKCWPRGWSTPATMQKRENTLLEIAQFVVRGA
jgi:hypothetical protein